MAAEQKIPMTGRFTPRQVAALKAEADRLGISEGDMLRRVVDGWLEAHGAWQGNSPQMRRAG